MIELTTQCPQCGSRFDVTLAQLQQRKGLLRCGQCAHIFDAYDCAVTSDQSTQTKRISSESIDSTKPFIGYQSSTTAPASTAILHATKADPHFVFEPESPANSVSVEAAKEQDEVVHTVTGPVPGAEASLYHEDLLRPHFIGDLPMATGVAMRASAAADASAIKAPITSSQPIRSSTEPSVSDIRVYLDQADRADASTVTRPVSPIRVRDSSVTNEGQVDERFTFTPEPRSTPLRSVSRDSESNAFVKGLWVLLFWVLLLALGLQLLYVYRAQIANTVGFTRPALQLMCDVVDCEIPYMREISAIEIRQSSLQQQVNTGAGKRYSYFLQLQLKNNLNWDQEWPTLVVSFSDAAAAVLATVAIPPEQYLAPSQRQRPFEAGAQHSVRVPVSLSNKKINGFTVEKYYP